jgi:hypothetical protein
MQLSIVRPVVVALGVFALLAASASIAFAAPVAQAVTPSLRAVDQPIINNTVVAAEVIAEVDGWVAVHAFEADGKLIVNQVVGESPIKAGSNRDVAVTIDETFNPGDSLVFMLHIDEGPTGNFDFPGGVDKAVVLNNQVVLTQFKVLGEGQPAMIPDTGDLSRQVGLIALVAVFVLLNGLALRRRSRVSVPITHD